MLTSYVKLAIKVLLRRKFFTAISLFGISFTLMILMVAASIFDQVLGPHPPAVHQGRTMSVYRASLEGPNNQSNSSPGYYLLDRFARDLPGAEAMTIFTDDSTVTSWIDGRKIETTIKRTDGTFWEIYRFDFLEGGPYADDDEREGNFVAVINETTRKRYFGGAPAVGRDIDLDGRSFRIVGVVRDVSMLSEPFAELWAPHHTNKSADFRESWLGGCRATLLFADKSQFAEARREFMARLEAAEPPWPEQFDTVTADLGTRVDHASGAMFGRDNPRPGAFKAVVVTGMLLFMLLPAVSLVNLNLSRILERASEIGVRKSFGASSRMLVGQFLVENVVLTLVGGAIGLALSYFAVYLLNQVGLVPYANHTIHPRVFLYGFAIAVVFGLVSGVWPAWRMSRLDPVEALRGGAA